MNAPLKQLVREHFEREQLASADVQRLQALLAVAPSQSRRSRRRLLVGIAAAVIAIAAAVAWRLWLIDDRDLRLRTAEEIALDHLVSKPLDVQASDIAALRPSFSRLEFALVNPAPLGGRGWTLLGGRYCSVQTVPAAQLRYRRADGALVTVYEVPYQRDLHGLVPDLARDEAPYTAQMRGVTVHLWVEQGLLIATAAEAAK